MNRDTRNSSAEDPDAVAATWVGRLDSGLTPEEEAELQGWRAADPRHEAAFDRFQEMWSALGRPRRTGAAPELTRELTALARRQRRRRFAVAGAGVAVLLAASASWWSHLAAFLPAGSSAPQVVLLIPERRALPDGSTIDYPAGAVISIDYSDDVRRVVLSRGEGLFQVANNPARPFVVEAAGVEVRALGTAFSIQIGREAVDVLVTEGTVSVERPRAATGGATSSIQPNPASEAAVLSVGQKAIVPLSAGSAGAVTAVDAAEIAARLAWRSPRVEFSGAPFADVVAVINRHNRTQFIIDDPTLGQVPMSGLFRADDPETFLRMIEAGLGVKAEHRSPGQIHLRKAP
jgi:transmembrane sensor